LASAQVTTSLAIAIQVVEFQEQATSQEELQSLLQALHDADPAVRSAAEAKLLKFEGTADEVIHKLIEVLQLPDDQFDLRALACKKLGNIGPPAQDAVPILLKESLKPAVKKLGNDAIYAARDALEKIVPDRAQLLVDAFTWNYQPAPGQAAAPLDDAASEEIMRSIISQELLIMGDRALPAVVHGMSHDNARIRRGAAFTLWRFADVTGVDFSVLERALLDSDVLVRLYAAGALFRRTHDPEKTLPVAVQALPDGERPIRLVAIETLANMGSKAAPSMTALLALLRNEQDDDKIRSRAAEALGEIKTTEAIPDLAAALHDPALSRSAARALKHLIPDSMPALIDALQDADPRVRAVTCSVFRDQYTDVHEAVPALQQLLQDESPKIRGEAILSLGGLGAQSLPAASALLKAFDTAEPEQYRLLTNALLNIDRDSAAAAIPILQQKLARDADRQIVVWCLFRLSAVGEPPVADLARVLSDSPVDRQFLTSEILRLFGDLGPRAHDAVPVLIELLCSKRADEFRTHVATTLGRIGAPAKPALESLREIAKDDNVQLAHAAREAVRLIEMSQD